MFVAIRLITQMHTNYCVDGSNWHFKFPKVVQAHTLGEVGIFDNSFVKGFFRDNPSNFY